MASEMLVLGMGRVRGDCQGCNQGRRDFVEHGLSGMKVCFDSSRRILSK